MYEYSRSPSVTVVRGGRATRTRSHAVTAAERQQAVEHRSPAASPQFYELCMERTSDGTLLAGSDLRRPMQVRRIGCALLNKWGLSGCRDSAALLMSELVTNAFQHGLGSVSFRMTYHDPLLELSVATDTPVPALVVRPTAPLDERGRGLMLVDALAESWGICEGRVWCTLASRPSREA